MNKQLNVETADRFRSARMTRLHAKEMSGIVVPEE